ncbi:hypothetical protein VCRA2119O430_310037 [Vibrio crassostreae]|nr:hypothetical protein VCRA2118O429_250015 [Vibrio crassostreae]CAK1940677.1 hypothetical protein VCRA2113O412_260015 [Vibrio crassostreae]CAK1944848.1 hypothetical protein VCRA2119O432_260059 [Vibrio crassostreae]CAK1953787.1 hypothetical protein VCRA2113O418_260062 [Vibrio crassostreae]CAK1961852.1 hypothetical protein VCRA2113O414_270059 [Vibrio crassostreae]
MKTIKSRLECKALSQQNIITKHINIEVAANKLSFSINIGKFKNATLTNAKAQTSYFFNREQPYV